MTRALITLAAGLAAAPLAGPALPPLFPGASVSMRVVVERPAAVKGPSQVVPWTVVSGLTANDFAVLVDGQAVAIESFSASDEPIALIVLVDASASAELNVTRLLEPLQQHVVPALRPGDVVAFGRFGGTRLYIDDRFNAVPRAMTTAARAVLARPKQMAARPGEVPQDPWLDKGGMDGSFGLGGSPAWDAVYEAVVLLRSQPGRRAILLVTDGRSTANVHGLNETIVHALSNDVAVSVVNESEDREIRQSETQVARVRPSVYLQPMAESTGGGYAALSGPGEQAPRLGDTGAMERWAGLLLANLVRDLHSAYALTFTSPVADGAVHPVEVRLKATGLRVRARRAYLAPSASR